MQLDDLNFWRSVVTVVSLLAFLALVARAWSRHSTSGFDEAAQLPFASDDAPAAPASERK